MVVPGLNRWLLYGRVCPGLGAVVLACAACATAELPPPNVPAPVSTERASLQLQDAAWREVRVDSQRLSVALPTARSWNVVHADTWFTVQHRPTQSRLEFKAWSQGTLVDAADCEAQALLWKPALRRPSEAALETLNGGWPKDYRGSAKVYAVAVGENSVDGAIHLAAASFRECFVLRFTTHAAGKDAREAVAERLALVVDKLLPTIRVVGVDQRVEREHRR
jgi:hypothetical protein